MDPEAPPRKRGRPGLSEKPESCPECTRRKKRCSSRCPRWPGHARTVPSTQENAARAARAAHAARAARAARAAQEGDIDWEEEVEVKAKQLRGILDARTGGLHPDDE